MSRKCPGGRERLVSTDVTWMYWAYCWVSSSVIVLLSHWKVFLNTNRANDESSWFLLQAILRIKRRSKNDQEVAQRSFTTTSRGPSSACPGKRKRVKAAMWTSSVSSPSPSLTWRQQQQTFPRTSWWWCTLAPRWMNWTSCLIIHPVGITTATTTATSLILMHLHLLFEDVPVLSQCLCPPPTPLVQLPACCSMERQGHHNHIAFTPPLQP